MTKSKTWLLRIAIALVVVGGGYFAWQRLRPQPLAAGLASGNGRIGVVEIDVATKTPGRIKEILVNEGDFVTAGHGRGHPRVRDARLNAGGHHRENRAAKLIWTLPNTPMLGLKGGSSA
jgi:hypothetical protein